MRKSNFPGFTMIELLITMAVIGALASMGLITFTGQQKSARDTQRKSDLQQYKIALENYANANSSVYPVAEGTPANVNPCETLSNFISACPSGYMYAYLYSSDGTKYTLWTQLERTANTNWVVCSNGKSGEKSTTGFSVSGGSCPL